MFRRCLSVFVLVALLGGSWALLGCSRQEPKDVTPQVKRLRVSGSGTALPLFTLLADKSESDKVGFVYLPGLHSGGGIQGVAGGDLEIGVVSRELTAEEQALALEYTKLSDDGLAVATNPSVTIKGLTSQQVRDVYAGVYTNWNELGGPDLGIVILDRAEDESAKIILRQYVLGLDLAISPSAAALSYESDMVAGLCQTKGSIGYLSLGLCISQAIPVRILELDGVEPSVASIQSGEYKMVRPLGVVVASPVSPEISDFLKWACSSEAVSFLAGKGFAPSVNP